MAKPWDESMKTLVRANPQVMISWLLANATFKRELHIELAKLSPEDIRNTGEINLLPFIPLTRGGATLTSVSRMLHELDTPEHKDLACSLETARPSEIRSPKSPRRVPFREHTVP